MTLGRKIAEGRRQKGMSQEMLAEQLGVSPQAVSKWENDASCPDIQLLPQLAQLLDTTVDSLLSDGETPAAPEVQLLPPEKRRPLDSLTLHVRVQSAEGDKVKINLPMAVVKLGMELGMATSSFQIGKHDALKNVDLNQVLQMVDSGLIGHLMEVESAEGDTVDITVD